MMMAKCVVVDQHNDATYKSNPIQRTFGLQYWTQIRQVFMHALRVYFYRFSRPLKAKSSKRLSIDVSRYVIYGKG